MATLMLARVYIKSNQFHQLVRAWEEEFGSISISEAYMMITMTIAAMASTVTLEADWEGEEDVR
jgi:hypothetical protein